MDVRVDQPQTEQQQKLTRQLLQLFEGAKRVRSDVEPVWEDIMDMVLPRLMDIKSDVPPKARRYGEKMFTSEPVSALRLASDGTSGYMMPRTSIWVRQEPMDKELYKIPGVRKFFEESTEALHAELNRSNFYGEMTPVLDNGYSLGTSCLFVENDDEKRAASIIALDPGEMYISENKYKAVDTFFRKTWMSGQRLIERFPDSIGGQLEQAIKKDPYHLYPVLHCLYKRNDRIHERVDAQNKPIASVYILMEKNALLRESGFDYQPMVAWRHRRISGTPYGGSPAWDALADILRLNQHSMDLLDAGHLAVRPPIAYPQEMGEYDIGPNGANPYRIPGRTIHKIDVQGDYPIGRDREEAIGKAIREHFQTDFFLLLTQSDRTKTAFEVAEMAGERAAVMSTVIGRIETELIGPTLELIYRIAAENGRTPQVPDAMLELGVSEYRWEYVGPLAQLQKRHHGQQTRTQIFMEAAPLMEIFPETRDIVDSDSLMRDILLEGGMSEDHVRNEDMVSEIRELRAQQEAEMQEQAMAMEAAKVAGGPKAPEPGSPGAEMTGAQSRATPRDL